MPPECAAELHASDKHSSIGLLTRHAHNVSKVVKIENFTELNHLVSVSAQVLQPPEEECQRTSPHCIQW